MVSATAAAVLRWRICSHAHWRAYLLAVRNDTRRAHLRATRAAASEWHDCPVARASRERIACRICSTNRGHNSHLPVLCRRCFLRRHRWPGGFAPHESLRMLPYLEHPQSPAITAMVAGLPVDGWPQLLSRTFHDRPDHSHRSPIDADSRNGTRCETGRPCRRVASLGYVSGPRLETHSHIADVSDLTHPRRTRHNFSDSLYESRRRRSWRWPRVAADPSDRRRRCNARVHCPCGLTGLFELFTECHVAVPRH
jgi:hypothetical protein